MFFKWMLQFVKIQSWIEDIDELQKQTKMFSISILTHFT